MRWNTGRAQQCFLSEFVETADLPPCSDGLPLTCISKRHVVWRLAKFRFRPVGFVRWLAGGSGRSPRLSWRCFRCCLNLLSALRSGQQQHVRAPSDCSIRCRDPQRIRIWGVIRLLAACVPWLQGMRLVSYRVKSLRAQLFTATHTAAMHHKRSSSLLFIHLKLCTGPGVGLAEPTLRKSYLS